MQIWLELSARASGGREPHLEIAGSIADRFLAWAADRLEGRSEAERRAAAALSIAVLNGLHVLETIGRAGVADVALATLASVPVARPSRTRTAKSSS